ncbi:MAG: hypothetical protein KIT73_11870 [Burkholderiales bacterium]|nr:hypothetical protein [Burkholderiales bacterium]
MMLCAVLVVSVIAVLLDARFGPWPGLFGTSFVVTLAVLGLLMVAVIALVQISRPIPVEIAAAVADREAGLRDLLTSALWLRRQPVPSGWAEVVEQRAAAAVLVLDPRRIVPFAMPSATKFAAGLAVLLVAALWFSPRLVPAEPHAAMAADAATAVRELAAEAGRRGDAEAQARLEQIVDAIERPGSLSPDEQRRALADAQAAIERRNVEAAADWDKVRQVADALQGREGFESVTAALERHDVRAAAQALRDIAQARGAPSAAVPDDGVKAALQAAVESEQPAGNDAIDQFRRAAEGLEQLAERLDAQQRINQGGRSLAALAESGAREAMSDVGRFRPPKTAPNPAGNPAPDGSNIDGTMARLGALDEERQFVKGVGGRAGDTSGDGDSEPLLGDAAAKIDVKYKRETVELPGAESRHEEADAESMFYAASRRGESKVMATDVAPVFRRVDEESPGRERIALRHRPIVRNYFTQPREQGSK